MRAAHNRERWSDLEARKEQTDVGRRLDAGGIVLADSFETMLQSLSEHYLHDAWERAASALTRYQLAPTDLSWGQLHPGETHIAGLENRATPSDYVGWTSRELKDFDQENYYYATDGELAQGKPRLRCAVSWRSTKWSIAPDNYSLGLRLIEARATNEITSWAPTWVLAHEGLSGADSGAWIAIAQALGDYNQGALDQAFAQARATYSPLGYRIVLRGFVAFAHQPGRNLALRFPQEPSE